MENPWSRGVYKPPEGGAGVFLYVTYVLFLSNSALGCHLGRRVDTLGVARAKAESRGLRTTG